MSHFYGEMFGSAKNPATMRGHKTTGLEAHLRGWNIGVKVILQNNNGVDEIYLYKTGGSNGSGRTVLLGVLSEDPELSPSIVKTEAFDEVFED
jgi:hypothetical protein